MAMPNLNKQQHPLKTTGPRLTNLFPPSRPVLDMWLHNEEPLREDWNKFLARLPVHEKRRKNLIIFLWRNQRRCNTHHSAMESHRSHVWYRPWLLRRSRNYAPRTYKGCESSRFQWYSSPLGVGINKTNLDGSPVFVVDRFDLDWRMLCRDHRQPLVSKTKP